MKVLNGKCVCSGVAMGKVAFIKRRNIPVIRRKSTDIQAEISRFEAAAEESILQLDEMYSRALELTGESNASIFDIHKMLIEDEDFVNNVRSLIESEGVNAEYAVAATADSFAVMLSDMDDDYMRERSADVRDILNRLLKNLSQNTDSTIYLPQSEDKLIICSDDISPTELFSLDFDRICGIAAAYGSLNSHTAILARSIGIPAVICLGEELLSPENKGELLIIDGHAEAALLSPDKRAAANAMREIEEARRKRELLAQLVGKDNITVDGRRIDILANVESANDITEAMRNDAGGIGFFCSEFLCDKGEPSEERLFKAYKRTLEGMHGKRVVVRTVIISENAFTTQLRALLRAAEYGNLSISFPLISCRDEFSIMMKYVDNAAAELTSKGIPFGYPEIGIVIDTPAAAILSDTLAQSVDFFSVDVDSLSEFAVGEQRKNNINTGYNYRRESFIRFLRIICDSAHNNGIRVDVCGVGACDYSMLETYLRMGIDGLSISPEEILLMRNKIRGMDLSCTHTY